MVKQFNRRYLEVLMCFGMLCAIAVIALTFTSCGRENANESEVSVAVEKRDINVVMEAHVDELMNIPGVVMVAVGQLEDKTPCITVYVKEKTAEILEKIPSNYEGHPVKFDISDEIRAL